MADVVVAVLILVGALLMFLSGIGMIRMPDLFMRLQAAAKTGSLGVGCILIAVAIHFGELAVTLRSLLVTAFVLITVPVGAHVIARAAYSVQVPLWEGTFHDDLEQEHAARVAASSEADDRGSES